MEKFTCCFIGHRDCEDTPELRKELETIIENLIAKEKVDKFLFGSKSRFNDICLEAVSDIKKEYPHIKRIYVRAEYPYIDDSYKDFLLTKYEATYLPERIAKAGKAAYVERNYEMIDKSNFCVFYYRNEQKAANYKSGTKAAIDYAESKKRKCLIILPYTKCE